MAAWLLPAAMGAFSIASSLFGGSSSSKAAKKAERQLAQQKASEDAWYRRKYNEDYADTAAGQNTLRMSRDYADKIWQKSQGAAAVAGGETEATAKAKEQGNKVVSDALANMASQNTERQESADASHNAAQERYSNQQMAIDEQKAANISNAASGVSNTFASGAVAMLQGMGTKGTSVPKSNMSINNSNSNLKLNNSFNDFGKYGLNYNNDGGFLQSLVKKNQLSY